MTMDKLDLTGQFLIAMPGMNDPSFKQTVSYLCSHTEEGAMGIVINRPMEIDLGEIFLQMELASVDPEITRTPIFEGGPMQQDHGIVLHKSSAEWDSMLQVTDELGIATSRDILEAICNGQGPEESLIALGYASWGAGQLEQELADNVWLNVPADPQILFNVPPAKRWRQATASLGFDLHQMSTDAGHV